MESDPSYGQKFVSPFRADAVSQLSVSGLKKSRLLVSRLRRETPGHGLVMALQQEGGAVYSVLLQLREQTNRELFVADKCIHRGSYAARTTSIVNHLERPMANLLSPFDNLMFTVPQIALDEIADERGVRRVNQLHCAAGGVFDETVWHLGNALLPALERPDEIGSLYAQQLMLAINTYFAQTFGGLRQSKEKTGTLAPWQFKRATEAMTSLADEDLSLKELASHCGLSVSYFVRAFKSTTGDSPHRWILRHRIELAKSMLGNGDTNLVEVAASCGFADQSHFTRMFRSFAGVTPAAWRRAVKS
ncbi:helix-turn-helix domain-containing protein [Rhizobium leguminosarum]|uniref:helix-turn-helix domain-containing protein n=1 Tax=Rhizobium ruizarguesonis TaxID=2081791 RepID=UPI0013E057E1|nr:AraC family transcriptional regulator [Rhizobium ruizarguesonis]NEJ90007.1 helix-turn-helix domain-containing protein [Rhizobium ruizarguesonis]